MSKTPLMELHERARAGDLDAMALTAVVAAVGVGEPASWSTAIERLGQAAKLGSAFADAQLTVLSETGLDDRAPRFAPQPLASDPPIYSLPGFVPKAACDWLISRATGRLGKSATYNEETGETRFHTNRTNSSAAFSFRDFDLVIVAIRARIAAATGSRPEWLEPPPGDALCAR